MRDLLPGRRLDGWPGAGDTKRVYCGTRTTRSQGSRVGIGMKTCLL